MEFESRILKESASIIKLGLFSNVYILGIWRKYLLRKEKVNKKCTIIRFRCIFDFCFKSALFKSFRIIEYSLNALYFCEKIKVSSVTVHSSSLLPLGFFLKLRFKARLTYAPHELESERIGLSKYQRIFIRLLEKKILPFADSISAPSFLIARWYSKSYKVKLPYLIYNTPFLKRPKFETQYFGVRNRFNIPKESVLFLYHGILDEGRGIEIICKSFQGSKRGFHILFCGFGNLTKTIKKYQEKCSAIHLINAVPPNMILNIAGQADVGICLIENSCLSYKFSLPNKLFEYMHAGLAVISSNFPTMRQVVSQTGVGWSIEPSSKSLNLLLQNISKREILLRKKYSLRAKKIYCWEKNENNILRMYRFINEKKSIHK